MTVRTYTLYRPWARCPEEACKRPIAFRITEAERDAAMGQAPDVVKGTAACHRPKCRGILVLTAAHYQQAVAVERVTIHEGRIVSNGTSARG